MLQQRQRTEVVGAVAVVGLQQQPRPPQQLGTLPQLETLVGCDHGGGGGEVEMNRAIDFGDDGVGGSTDGYDGGEEDVKEAGVGVAVDGVEKVVRKTEVDVVAVAAESADVDSWEDEVAVGEQETSEMGHMAPTFALMSVRFPEQTQAEEVVGGVLGKGDNLKVLT